MKRLANDVTSRQILEYLTAKYGDVREVSIYREILEHSSAPLMSPFELENPVCAKAIFDHRSEAERAVEELGGLGANIRLDDEPELDELNVFVSNLPENVKESELRDAFDMLGPVLSVGMLNKKLEGDVDGPIIGFARFRS